MLIRTLKKALLIHTKLPHRQLTVVLQHPILQFHVQLFTLNPIAHTKLLSGKLFRKHQFTTQVLKIKFAPFVTLFLKQRLFLSLFLRLPLSRVSATELTV